MRTSLVWLLTVALVMGSAVGVLAQQPETGDQGVWPVEAADPPPGYAEGGPGFYPYGRDPSGELTYRFYDGAGWVGLEVDAVIAYIGTVLSQMGVSDWTILFVSLVLSGPDGAEYLGQLLGRPVPPAEEPVRVEEPPSSTEGAQNHGASFTFGATIALFDGQVTGDKNGWRYEGLSIKSSPGRYHEKSGRGTLSCTFKGDPEDPKTWDVPGNCTVTWQGEEEPWNGSGLWGTFEPVRDHKTNEMTGFKWHGCWYVVVEGQEHLPDSDPRKFKCDYPQVLLRPAARSEPVPWIQRDE